MTSTTHEAAFPSAFAGVVVDETWPQLESGKGQYDFTPLDQSLAAATSYNSAHATDQLGVKLRIWGGFTAPRWAKTMDSAPLAAASGTGSTSPTGTLKESCQHPSRMTTFALHGATDRCRATDGEEA